jgi:hypothetical protein
MIDPKDPSADNAEQIDGLPRDLPEDSCVTLFDGGTAIAIAIGDRLTTYTLTVQGGRHMARESGRHALSGQVGRSSSRYWVS